MSIERRILPRRRGTASRGALIGPNAVLKTVEVMEERLGHAETRAILADAQLTSLPSGAHMIPEIEALRLHRWLALHDPLDALEIAEEAGARTADYIVAHRIPEPAAWLLRCLPPCLAAPMLMAVIRKHAWTFVGAGAFSARSAWRFTIDRSAADDIAMPFESLFHWYAAVFSRLYRQLVASDCSCRIAEPDAPSDVARTYTITRGK
jgi:divinyl protochlorophyllide a 8-vinyl-reductase